MERKTLMNTVADRALACRISLSALCKRAGVSPTIATRWNNGANTPSLRTIGRLEDAINEVEESRNGRMVDGAEEAWRLVDGWPYEVSDHGNIRRLGAKVNLKQWRTKKGRWQARMVDGNRRLQVNVYRQVAIAFIGPPPFEGAEVAHRDDDKDINCLSNLKWCTHQQNCGDRRANGKAALGDRNGAHTHPHRRPRGESSGLAKLTAEQVDFIRAQPNGGKHLAKKFNVSYTTIKDVRSGKTWNPAVAAQAEKSTRHT